MSMHLESPALTTTSTKKRRKRVTKAGEEELVRNWRDRNERLKEMGLPKETFEQFSEWLYGRGKKEKKSDKNQKSYTSSNDGIHKTLEEHRTAWKSIRSLNDTPAPCTKKSSPTYTGEKMIGIAVMHKSCLQPVFSQEEAIDSAKMRR